MQNIATFLYAWGVLRALSIHSSCTSYDELLGGISTVSSR